MITLLELEPIITFGAFLVGWVSAMVTGILFVRVR